ncbi:hypothetical protein KF840_18910 [bacterium]|nr:hypothetical protein [bacterium]
MRRRLIVVLAASAMLCAVRASAHDLDPQQDRPRHPGAAALAAVGNVVYAPVRFVVTLLNAGTGGLTGHLTMGDRVAANDVFGLTDGQGFLQPEMFTGQESLAFGEYRYSLQVTKP